MSSDRDRLNDALRALDVQAAVVDGAGRLLAATTPWHETDQLATASSLPVANLLDSLRARAGEAVACRAGAALQALAAGGDTEEIEFRASPPRGDGEVPRPERWYRLRLVRSGADGNGLARFAAEIRDVSDEKTVQATLRSRERRLKLTNVLLRELSERDPLTSLWNRRGIERALQREQRQSQRTGLPLSALLIDCDDFKRVNDRYGHSAGDRLLRRLGKILQMHLRPRDLAARIGGDEFLVLLPSTDTEAATTIAERVRVQIARDLAEEAEFVRERVTVSLGLASIGADTVSIDAVVGSTQDALKRAKGTGKNRVSGLDEAGGAE